MAELKLKRETEARKPTRKKRQAVTRSLYRNDDSDDDGLDQEGEEDDFACIYCNDLYSRSKPDKKHIEAKIVSRIAGKPDNKAIRFNPICINETKLL
ncbi:hypothetical protein HHI36_018732 [Cryptolaemus montrouzieri]|uniref:Uncharacterized protein n=1 Tax=Cryptolaemus montrouzieri TaxID=559131 RepID=A0ABD2P0T6_9CUCU